MSAAPILVWFRQDLRLTDNPALHAAAETGRPVIPLFILDAAQDGRPFGAASLWWLDKSLSSLGKALEAKGSRLILDTGDSADVLERLLRETGAGAVYWNRLYGPASVDKDLRLEASLGRQGVEIRTFNASLLIEPHRLSTQTGGAYKVFTPFWRAARLAIGSPEVLAAPERLQAPPAWPYSGRLSDWKLHPQAPDWSHGFDDWSPGEAGALSRLDDFLEGSFARYADDRDKPAIEGSSRLSPHLHWGEIGPRQVWRAAHSAEASGLGSERQCDKLLAEIGWREFNHHLLFSHPHLAQRAMRTEYERLPWRTDKAGLEAWRTGRTGYPIVDAGMRQLWTTGWMHNRVRLIAASFLVKDLLVDWREGERWFWDTLVDACAANNPGNWQWVAGCGADASPWFRIFNPVTQGEKFDPKGDYVRQWVPELAGCAADAVHRPWEAGGVDGYPPPVVEHGAARLRALDALKALK